MKIYSRVSKLFGTEESSTKWGVLSTLILRIIPSLVLGGIVLVFAILFLPFVRIRIGRIYSSRLGHFLLETDDYLTRGSESSSDFGFKRRTLDIFFYDGSVANSFYAKYLSTKICIFPKSYVLGAYIICRALALNFFLVPLQQRTIDCSIFTLDNQNFQFSEEDLLSASKLFQQFPIDFGREVVCIYIRDSAYEIGLGNNVQEVGTNYRNNNASSFVPMIKYLLNSNFVVFRMGTVAEEKLEISDSNFVDIPFSEHKSDLLDFYITSKCSFAISTDTGMTLLPIIFRKPIILANLPGFHSVLKGSLFKLFTFKKFIDVATREPLSLRQIVSRGGLQFDNEQSFRSAGISWVDNSEEELLELAREYVEKLRRGLLIDPQNMSAHKSLTAILGSSYSGLSMYLSENWLSNNPNFLN